MILFLILLKVVTLKFSLYRAFLYKGASLPEFSVSFSFTALMLSGNASTLLFLHRLNSWNIILPVVVVSFYFINLFHYFRPQEGNSIAVWDMTWSWRVKVWEWKTGMPLLPDLGWNTNSLVLSNPLLRLLFCLHFPICQLRIMYLVSVRIWIIKAFNANLM